MIKYTSSSFTLLPIEDITPLIEKKSRNLQNPKLLICTKMNLNDDIISISERSGIKAAGAAPPPSGGSVYYTNPLT